MDKKKDDKKYGYYDKYIIWSVTAIAIAGVCGVAYLNFSTIKKMESNVTELEATISDLQSRNTDLTDKLQTEQDKNSSFQNQIGEIASTVGKLDKLSRTDKELLQKYSKVYFLNENYVPEDLALIPSDYLYHPSTDSTSSSRASSGQENEKKIHTKVLPFLQSMMSDAKAQGIDIQIISAYRSFGEQGALKESYTFVYGTGANKFSADQGYSEHQLGTTVDLTTLKLGAGFTGFKRTDGYSWLLENAYKYGFVISYPEGNSYYQFEPWHWRFVGRSLAKRLHEEKENFYDLDQRTIDNYLINIFD